MSRFHKYIGGSYPWTVRTERDYPEPPEPPEPPLGEYLFTTGFLPGSSAQTETYHFVDPPTPTIKDYNFTSSETGYSVHDVRSFIDLGDGHWAVALRLEKDSTPTLNWGSIVETRDYGQTWVVRYSPNTTGWTGGVGDRAWDIRDFTVGNDGLIYAAITVDSQQGGILRFDPDDTLPPEWCYGLGTPWGGAGFNCYGIVQDSLDRWYMYVNRRSGFVSLQLFRMPFVASTNQSETSVWNPSISEADNDEKLGLDRQLRKMRYSAATDTIWVPTDLDGIWTYDVAGASWSEYLISTDFNTDFSAVKATWIQLDAAGDPEWISCAVHDPGFTFLYHAMLNRRSGNLFDCYLFDE